MIALHTLRTAPGCSNLLLFDDEGNAGQHYLLPLDLAADGPAALTVMGRGPRSQPEGIMGGFWNLALRSDVTDADRAAIAAQLSLPDQPPPRLVMAEADLDLHLILLPEPETGGSTWISNWRGGTIAMRGKGPAGEAGAALARAWEQGLPDAQALMTLTLRGLGAPDGGTARDEDLRLSVGEGRLTLTTSTTTTTTRRQAAAVLSIRREQPLHLPRGSSEGDIIWAGFDPD